jgi:uncharacterized membrane protein
MARLDRAIHAVGPNVMGTNYNEIAGNSTERIAALSDGIFAVAMTLLVLDLHTPAVDLIHGNGDLIAALAAIAPKLGVYVMSFLTLGIFWVGQQTQLNFLARANRELSWLHLLFLFFVTLMPFSTALIGAFIAERAALLVYWLNILLLGAALLGTWRYSLRAKLTKPDMPATMQKGVERRILIAQALYAAGAALCLINNFLSLAFILLVQLNYAIAPKLWFLRKL